MTDSVPTDADLLAAQAEYAGSTDVHAYGKLAIIERAHFDAQPPLTGDDKPRLGDVVIDKERDLWRWGRTRWSCMTPVDGERIRNVARLPHQAMLREYGPVKLIGNRSGLRYKTIRGRR